MSGRGTSPAVRGATAVGLVLCAAAGVVAVRGLPTGAEPPAGSTLRGAVVDERGRGVEGATVRLGSGADVRTDATGRFSAQVDGGARLVRVEAPGHLPRTQAVEPGVVAEVPLTLAAGSTVSLRFGGDVMFGRRYLDRDEDGDRSDGALAPDASAADHAALLEHVEPLLADADLTVVNLETPLLQEPYVDPTAPRPPDLHPTKEFVFASAPASVAALRRTGVDLVSLGNNHVLDALGAGLDATIDALDRDGMPHFGAGRDADEAWAPAVVERRGQRFAYLACTTITGTEHAIPYVAAADRPGAAQCETRRLAREVQAARARADTVVVMLHGGEEYVAEQTELVRRLTSTAEQAGAALVVNGHPHVVGGVHVQGRTLVAESLGNLLFDQTVWPTFVSYLLRVDVRDGAPVAATVDPLQLEHEIPRPTVGSVAQVASRRAAGLLPGPVALQGPGAAYLPARPAPDRRTALALPAGAVERLPLGTWVDEVAGRAVRLGDDLLWTGHFEDLDTDPATSGAHQWAFGDNVRRTARAACGTGTGMELTRSPVSGDDVVLTPTHRQLATAGTRLSLLADVRSASPGATLELALFGDTRGGSLTTLRTAIPSGERDADSCERVRLDAVLPPGVVAVQPFVRLVPPGGVQRGAQLAVDDVLLVAWAADGASGRRYDVVEAAQGATELELRSDRTR